jgi:3-phenylpropionate/cinnamic acid dioxygenase small subunit
MSFELQAKAQDLLVREAWLLDVRAWDEWLELYAEDAVFWVPTWIDDDELATDPTAQLSSIYVQGQRGLRERVQKTMDPRSPSSLPLARTAHLLGPVRLSRFDDSTAITQCAWQTLIYDPKSRRRFVYAGRYEHQLARLHDGSLAIQKKTISVINDEIESRLDFFYV